MIRHRLLVCDRRRRLLILVAILIALFLLYLSSRQGKRYVTPSATKRGPLDDLVQGGSRFLIANDGLCSKYKPQLLIWVHSATPHFEKRQAVRKTWAQLPLYAPMNVTIVFSLAVTKHQHEQERIYSEQKEHGDIIQDGGFIDAYHNLTYKAQCMLKWCSTHCQDLKLLLKVDDDTFLIPKRLTMWLGELQATTGWPPNTIMGRVWDSPDPYRRPSKWRVTEQEWPDPIFALKACSGAGYFISGDAIRKLKDAISQARFVWVDDMYATGVLAEIVGLNHIHIARHYEFIYFSDSTPSYTQRNRAIFLVGNMPSDSEIYAFWKDVQHFD